MPDCCSQAKTRVDMVHMVHMYMVHMNRPTQVAAKGWECLFGRRMTLVALTTNAGRARGRPRLGKMAVA